VTTTTKKCEQTFLSVAQRADSGIVRCINGPETLCLGSVVCNGSGDGVESISSEQDSFVHLKPDARIIWEFWRMAGRQSDYRYRGAPNEVDVGEIS
jgi:hypothetical protein